MYTWFECMDTDSIEMCICVQRLEYSNDLQPSWSNSVYQVLYLCISHYLTITHIVKSILDIVYTVYMILYKPYYI